MPSSSSPEPAGPIDWSRVRARFVLPRAPDGGDAAYLAGNSLGALPRAVAEALAHGVTEQWGAHGVEGWDVDGWWDAPTRLGARIAPLLGAHPLTVVVGDSTSVHLFNALVTAARLRPGRSVLLTDPDHFPTDRYLAASVARLTGLEVRHATPPEMAPDADTAVVSVPAVDFRTGERWDLAGVVERAHRAGAVVVADLSHAVGAMPVDLGGLGVHLAVGCTYKYLNAGPGAPAFVAVSEQLRTQLDPPLTGWAGHARPFAMEEHWAAAPGVRKLRVGTPSVLAMLALDAALTVFDDLPLDAVRARSLALGDAFLDALPARVEIVTPPEHARRGGHLTIRVADAPAARAALAERGVIVDDRPPDLLRFAFAAPYVSDDDAVAAAHAVASVR